MTEQTVQQQRREAVRNIWAGTPLPPLPDKFSITRPHQRAAIDAILEAFERYDVVFLDAPTGSGKTLIAERVRRRMKQQGDADGCMYICSDLALQQQFVNDYPYAKVLRGKVNYPTELGPRTGPAAVNCGDCTLTSGKLDDNGQRCAWCNSPATCPYLKARREAEFGPLAVLNTAYYLAEANTAGKFGGRPLVIIDECDALEGALLGYVELRLTKRYVETMGFSLPDKGVRKPALVVWLEAFADRLHEYVGVHSEELKPRERERYLRDAEDCKRVAAELRVLVKGDDGEEVPDDYEKGIMGRWVRDYSDKDALALKPIMVDKYAQRYLWRHGHKHLLMSASIISADEMAFSLGLEEGSYTTVTVPSTFPVENRPIVYAPVMPVTHVNKQAWTAKLGPAVMNILYAHPDDRVLIHCVNYQLAKDLHAYVADIYWHMGVMRPLHTYTGRQGKEQALQDYLRQPASVMFAPSMDRGVDLPDDLCRVQIVCKVPYVSLGDAQVSQRLHSPGGQLWYTVQNVRTIVQMVGRGVRHKDDSCTTYVLDKEFGKMMKKHRMLLPGWFAEAVDMGSDVRWVLK